MLKRLLILALLFLLPIALARAADHQNDAKKLGQYAADLSPAIATLNRDLVLKHPEVERQLRAVTGPYYEQISNMKLGPYIGYEPSEFLILRGHINERQMPGFTVADDVLIVVPWSGLTPQAVLRTKELTIIFSDTHYMSEHYPAISAFAREEQTSTVESGAAHEPWLRIMDFRKENPVVWQPNTKP